MQERRGEKVKVRTETQQTDQASSLGSWPKCHRLSYTESILPRAPRAATATLLSPSPLAGRWGPAGPNTRRALQRQKGGDEQGGRGEGGRGCREEATVWFQLTLSPPPASFFTPFSFQTGKSVPRSVFPPRFFLPNPGRSSRPGASWWGARWKPLGARERGARSRSRGGTWPQAPRAHPEAPRPARPRSVGCAQPPRRPAAAKREVPAVGIEMTLLFLLWLGECLGASGRPEGPGKHTPASGPGRWLSTVVLQSLE